MAEGAKKKGAAKITWFCKNKREDGKTCNAGIYLTKWSRKEEIMKSKSKFCPECRKHTEHVYKEAK